LLSKFEIFEGDEKIMEETDEKRIRSIVRSEIIGILQDAQEALGMKKDPTGMGKKALEGLAMLIRRREDKDKTKTI
jgi:hypothetical protein